MANFLPDINNRNAQKPALAPARVATTRVQPTQRIGGDLPGTFMPQRHPIGISTEPTPPFLPPQRPTLGPTPVAGDLPEAIPDITEEQVDAAVEAVSDKDGNFSWGDVIMAVGRGIGGIAGAVGPAGIGALAGAAMGGGLQGAAYGAVGAMTGKYKGMAEGMELRQKYALTRQKMGNALRDDRVKNLKFLYDQQIKGHQYEKAARTMTQISTLTNVNLSEDDNTAMHMAMKVEYRKKNFEKDFDTAMAGIYGAGATPDQQLLTAYAKRFTEDESNIRAMLGIPDGTPVTQAHRDSALRTLGRHVEGFQQGASESFIKALHSQHMMIAKTQNQFLGSFWAKIGEGQKWRGHGQQDFESAIAAFTQAQNQGHSPGYVNMRAALDSLPPAQKMKLIKDNISDIYSTRSVNHYVALMNQSGHQMTTSQAAIGLVSGVLDAGQLEEIKKHIDELDLQTGSATMAMAPEVTQAAPPGQQGPLPTPTPPGATPTPPGATMGPGQQGPLPAPAPTPAGLGAAHTTVQQEGLADRVLYTIMDNPDLANATSPEDMLDQAARIDPSLKQAISDTGVKQALALMFSDTSKYKRFVTEGTPERDLAQLQRGKRASDWQRTEGKYRGIGIDPDRKIDRIEKARERLAESDQAGVDTRTSIKEILAHYRSGSENSYTERLSEGTSSFPFGAEAMNISSDVFRDLYSKESDEMLKKQPEYKEMLKAGVPEKEALDVFRDALYNQKDWRDDERVTEAVLEDAPEHMRNVGGAAGQALLRQRLSMLTRGGGSPSSPGAGDTTDSPAPVTTSPSQIQPQNTPQRRRNPGNTQAGGVADQWAQRDSDGNLILDEEGHLQFETAEDGFKAMEADITAKISGNSPATQKKLKKPNVEDVDELGKVYAEDPNWANNVKSILKRDHDIDADSIHIRQIPIPALVDSISKAEGFLA